MKAKTERLEKEVSSLKAEKSKLSGLASTSSGCEAEKLSNDRINIKL